MARYGRFGFLAIAIIFHFIYIYSIFDIYFVSPIVHGMSAYSVRRAADADAPAKRLVLFVGDGLRADKAFQSFPDPSPETRDLPGAKEPRPLAPFLRSKVLQAGTFGVSHTRMPTESRPGHVALIAGLYEDVSSVTTGWKLNPVNFDSVFNRSRHTWSWGSPDILPMFKEGAVPGRVDADCYGEEFEDFTKDATQLDTWVFDHVKAFFASAAKNHTLDATLRQDKNVFFLHLLGLDTTGHAYRPYSDEYLHNIKLVDAGVKEISKVFEDFYGDGKTAFVFTADHGISDWGSHGDGHPDNTRTPLIAWGSGVAKPVTVPKGKASGHEDGFSFDWGFDHVQRNDVSQADIAALMAYLAGLDFPVNSVGELPLAYVAGNAKEKAEAAFANTQEVLEMYRVKEAIKRSNEIRYRGFGQLSEGEHSIDKRLAAIRQVLDAGDYESAIATSQDLLKIGLDGLRYLQTYDWLFLRALVTSGFLGWIAFAVTTVIDMHVLHGKTKVVRSPQVTAAFGACGALLFALLLAKKSPFAYYTYAIFPLVFWEEVVSRREALVRGSKILFQHIVTWQDFLGFAGQSLAYLAIMEALVLSYSQRSVYTICFLLAQFWPLMYGRKFVGQNKILVTTWAVACQAMSVFTLLDAMKVENLFMILGGGFLMTLVGVLYLLFERSILSGNTRNGQNASALDGSAKTVVGVQIGLIVLSMIVTNSTVASLQAKNGLPLGNQVIGWTILVASLAVPFIHSSNPQSNYLHRLMTVFLTFSPIFIILTISYEGLFYLAFCATLVTWVRLEHHVYAFNSASVAVPPATTLHAKKLSDAASDIAKQLSSPTETASNPSDENAPSPYRPLALGDARISLFFFFLLQSAFFSTGNIASISSFSLESVYRLIPVFNPFSQGALLMFKILIPFAIISANLGILNRRLRVAPSSLFMVVMAISDVMTLNFFFLVRDEGSWLDIGTSISHYVIASLVCVFVAGLEFISEVFVSGVDVGDEGDSNHPAVVHANGSAKHAKAKANGAVKGLSNGSAKKS